MDVFILEFSSEIYAAKNMFCFLKMNSQRSEHENLIQEALFWSIFPKNVVLSQVLSINHLPLLQELGE